jgi:hypothetical protein
VPGTHGTTGYWGGIGSVASVRILFCALGRQELWLSKTSSVQARCKFRGRPSFSAGVRGLDAKFRKVVGGFKCQVSIHSGIPIIQKPKRRACTLAS